MRRSLRPTGNAGQSLVELAFVLPSFCVSVLVIVQTVVFCWNQVELQRMAQVVANDAASSTMAGTRPYHWRQHLWGNIVPVPLRRYERQSFTTARAYRGVSTVELPPRLMKIRLTGALMPRGGFVPRWLIGSQQSSAYTFIEAPFPGESA